MTFFTKKEQIVIILLILVIVIISIFSLLNKNFLANKNEDLNKHMDIEDMIENLEEEEDIVHEGQSIMIHISGQIYNPGIIELESDSRVIDAVNLAGGLKKDADLDRINLAKKLLDEEKIYIPKIGEDIPVEVSNEIAVSNSGETGYKIDINTCTKEQLMTLPGIGEVLAQRILDYREGNLFKTIDEIKNVSGIGEKKYESIKEFIIVR